MSGDIGQMQVGRPPTGIRTASPVPPPSMTPVPSAAPATGPIEVPPAGPPRRSRLWLFVALGLVVLVLLAVVIAGLFSGGGGVAETPTPTPSATLTFTPTPTPNDLSSYFGVPDATLSLSAQAPASDLQSAMLLAQPEPRQAISFAVTIDGRTQDADGVLRVAIGDVTGPTSSSMGTDLAVLAFGQTEAFDSTGQRIEAASTTARLVLVLEAADAGAVNAAMMAAEAPGPDLANAAATAFGYDPSQAIVEGFSPGTYRGVTIRYWNFPYADRSLDWAVLTASNGKDYLLLAGSRESVFFAIDQLMQ